VLMGTAICSPSHMSHMSRHRVGPLTRVLFFVFCVGCSGLSGWLWLPEGCWGEQKPETNGVLVHGSSELLCVFLLPLPLVFASPA
jgi:hypothetical protein